MHPGGRPVLAPGTPITSPGLYQLALRLTSGLKSDSSQGAQLSPVVLHVFDSMRGFTTLPTLDLKWLLHGALISQHGELLGQEAPAAPETPCVRRKTSRFLPEVQRPNGIAVRIGLEVFPEGVHFLLTATSQPKVVSSHPCRSRVEASRPPAAHPASAWPKE